MSVAELKERIRLKLSEEDNEEILREVAYRLHVEQDETSVSEPEVLLSATSLDEIKAAIAEDEAGATLTHAQVMANAWQMIADFENKSGVAKA